MSFDEQYDEREDWLKEIRRLEDTIEDLRALGARLLKERDALLLKLQNQSDDCWHDQASGPSCVRPEHRPNGWLGPHLTKTEQLAHDATVAAMEDLAKKCEAEIVQLKLTHETSDLPRHHFTWLQLERFLKAIRAAIPLPPGTGE